MKLVHNKAELHDQQEKQKQEDLQRCQKVNLYVKNFDDNFTVNELRETFSQYGTVTRTHVMFE